MAQIISVALQAVLDAQDRDLLDVYELYEYNVTDLNPANATKRFSSTRITWNGHDYDRAVVSRGDVSRYMGEQFNSVSVTLSNVDNVWGGWVRYNNIEGMRLVVRTISRPVNDSSIVLFVGRCEKAVEVDRKTVQISAKQDLGSIEVAIPRRTYGQKCPLEFKGRDCLGTEAVGAKSTAYRNATVCNKSHDQCVEYGNTKFFQGFRTQQFHGTFKVKERRGGAGGAALSLLGLGSHKVKKQWTSQDDSSADKVVALAFGRVQAEGIPVRHVDTGQYVAGESAFCEGPVSAMTNVRNNTSGFADTFQAGPFNHLGEYGGQGSQSPQGFFASAADYYSRTCHSEYTIKGDNPDTGDPAPTISAVIRGQKITTPDTNGVFNTSAWSDNPVWLLRFLMTDPNLLNHPAALVDDAVANETGQYCNEIISDDSKSEQLYLPTAVSSQAGTDFKRFRSTGLVDTFYFRYLLGLDGTPPEFRETTYNFFNPAAPPDTITAINYLRRRFTCNLLLSERTKAADLIYRTLLPIFRGYLVTSAQGKIQIRSEKDADSTLIRQTTGAGATELPIENVEPWKTAVNTGYRVLALIGLGLSTSEVQRVLSTRYSTAGNSVTLATSATGSITLTRSGSTLSGGSASVAASGTVTVGGSISAGDTAQITLDGISVGYTINANDTTGTIAALLAALINANATLRRYLKATWSTNSPTVITITSKLGFIQFGSAQTANSHATAEECIRISASFTQRAQDVNTHANIVEDSFKWLLGSKQTSYNQFVINYIDALADFAPTQLIENDEESQTRLGKVNKLEIDGSGIDSYNQANRIVVGARKKYGDNAWFASWTAGPAALVLEEGDLVCASHDSGAWLNRAMRLEEVKIGPGPEYKMSLVGRYYSSDLFPDMADPRTVPLVTAATWPTTPPGQPTSLTLSEVQPGTVRGTFAFGSYVGDQWARVLVKKAGASDYVDTGIIVRPDASGNGSFEVSGLPTGSTKFKVVPENKFGNQGTASDEATIVVSGVTITLDYVFGDGSSLIPLGLQDYLPISFACEILEWTLIGDVSGSIVVDIWKAAYANYPPTGSNSITGSAKPQITTALKNTSSTLTGWTTTINAGDIIALNVDSVSGFTRCTLSLKLARR